MLINRLKNYQLWLLLVLTVTVAFGFAFWADEVYDGWNGNLQLSRALFMAYWFFITVSLVIEGLISARIFSVLSSRSISLLPFAIAFGVIGFCGLGPIGLMSLIGFALIFLVPIFTILLLAINIFQYFRRERLA